MKSKGNLLLIDDDPELLHLLEIMLSAAGHQVTTSVSWKQVVTNLNLAAQSGKAFDAIVLDLMMPDRSGFDILRSLKVILFPLPPIIVLTALSDLDHAVSALELGAAVYLTKPVAKDKLLETIRDILEGKEVSGF